MKTLTVFTDGGSRGNPGPAAIGVYVLDENQKPILKLGKQIGFATNNIAEYSAVLEALVWINNNFKQEENVYNFFLDSSLVVNQLNGKFKIKNEDLKKIIIKIKNFEKEITGKFFFHHIPRDKNKMADALVNSAF